MFENKSPWGIVVLALAGVSVLTMAIRAFLYYGGFIQTNQNMKAVELLEIINTISSTGLGVVLFGSVIYWVYTSPGK